METVKTRSESPFSKTKNKGQILDNNSEIGEAVVEQIKTKNKEQLIDNNSEIGEAVVEQTKTKKKGLRNKQKAQLNGDTAKNGVEDLKVLNNVEKNNKENDFDNGNKNQKEKEKDKDGVEKKEINDVNEKSDKTGKNEKSPGNSIEEAQINAELQSNALTVENADTDSKKDNVVSEVESTAKKDEPVSKDEINVNIRSNSDEANEKFEDNINEDTNNLCHPSSSQDLEMVEEQLVVEEPSQNGTSDFKEKSLSEDSHLDQIQASPDTATGKEEKFFSNKISNFLGKWTPASPSKEDKQNSEVSFKGANDTVSSLGGSFSHPFLSKVSGRRGIRDMLSSSLLSSQEMKTPTNTEGSLNDSFRVRTNPSRLNSSEVQENPTLRKFKGKRCLISNDDPEDEEDLYVATTKRRKLESNGQESGLLGSIFWSPFSKKKSLENEATLKLTNTESKLTRFLSPFWFWKKTASGQKTK